MKTKVVCGARKLQDWLVHIESLQQYSEVLYRRKLTEFKKGKQYKNSVHIFKFFFSLVQKSLVYYCATPCPENTEVP